MAILSFLNSYTRQGECHEKQIGLSKYRHLQKDFLTIVSGP